MIDNPIFIIGTERSGSNLLRLLLNAHPHISIPHPPHIMRDFAPLVSRYGDLEQKENFNQLVDDVIKVVEFHFSPWPFKLNKDEVIAHAPSKTLYGVYVALYETYLKFENKNRWGCKSTFMFSEIESIIKHHHNPRFIHLVRDPRDIAVSAGQSIFSKYHPYKMAELWKNEQDAIEKWSSLRIDNKLLTIRYEDLTNNPEGELKKIMDFLGEEFHLNQLNYFQEKEAKRLANLSKSWAQVQKPVNTNSVGQYKAKLTLGEVELIEFLCSDLMKKYHYQLETKPQDMHSPSLIKKIEIELLDKYYFLKTESSAAFSDRNFFLRWKKKLLLKKLALKY
jgi:hypothetical protein